MVRIDACVLVSAVVVFGAGCAGQAYAGPAGAEGPPLVAGSTENDGDLQYVQAAPAEDMGVYPSVMYGGVDVYYVGGLWYERGPRGWGYYRQEPRELGRQREEHFRRDHDPRWSDQRGAANRGQPGHGAAPAQREGVTAAQGREQAPGRVAPTAQQRRKQVAPAPTTKRASVKRAPARATPSGEHR
jgi:hypothetical protein